MADHLGETAVNLVKSRQNFCNTLATSQAALTAAAKYARLLLGSSRTGEANDPKVYTAAIIAILSHYPEDVMREVCDPYSGLSTKVEWLPKPKEVKEACEAIEGPRRRAREWEAQAQRQLAERAQIESGPRKLPQRIMDELAAHGLTNDAKVKNIESAANVMTRLGLTQEQWDAIPNAKEPPKGTTYPERL